MESKKFELFGGCLGNGTTVCNKAITENGDYKKIAHISNGGRIKFYIDNPETYIPDEDMKTIISWSEAAEKKFKEWWFTLSDIDRYQKMYDAIPYSVLLENPLRETLEACTDLREKVTLLEKIYLEKYI